MKMLDVGVQLILHVLAFWFPSLQPDPGLVLWFTEMKAVEEAKLAESVGRSEGQKHLYYLCPAISSDDAAH